MTHHARPVRRTFALLAVSTLLLTGCGSGTQDPEAAPTPSGPHVPTGPAATLTPERGDGDVVELEGAGSVVVPDGAQVGDPTSTSAGAQQLDIRMPDADESGLPAVQVTWGADDVGVFEQSWSTENAAKVDPSISDYVRSVAQWPGSDESVVATWSEDVALADGGSLAVSAVRLTVQDASGTTVVVLALAPQGELEGSDVERTVRSLELG